MSAGPFGPPKETSRTESNRNRTLTYAARDCQRLTSADGSDRQGRAVMAVSLLSYRLGESMAEVLRSFDEADSPSTGSLLPARRRAVTPKTRCGKAGSNLFRSTAARWSSRRWNRGSLSATISSIGRRGSRLVYAEGSLDRALHPITVRTRAVEVPASDAPARRVVKVPYTRTAADSGSVRGWANEASTSSRRSFARSGAPGCCTSSRPTISRSPDIDTSRMTDEQLIALIVTRVETRLAGTYKVGPQRTNGTV